MNPLLKSALIGGVLGGTFAAVRTRRHPAAAGTDRPPAAPAVAKGVARGTVAGGIVGLVLDRRARAAATARAAELAEEGTARGRRLAEAARPVVGSTLDTVSDQLHGVSETMVTSVMPSVVAAAERAVDVVGDAVDASRPHLHDALTSGREGLHEAVEAARPAVETAVDAARARAAAMAA
ncbi:hypothetical protein BH23ACT2_BH23ACT2_25860 [soil metagenome]